MEPERAEEKAEESPQQEERRRPSWCGCGWGCALLIVLVFAMIHVPGFVDAPRANRESIAKSRLRSLGSNQLAYQHTNNMREFGSFEALRRDLYIREGETLGNTVWDYSLSWGVASPPVGRLVSPRSNAFTIIAYPTNSRLRLHTFAITEDQVVRVYNPESGNLWESVKMWDPIL